MSWFTRSPSKKKCSLDDRAKRRRYFGDGRRREPSFTLGSSEPALNQHIDDGTSFHEAVGGALRIIGAVLTPFLRQRRIRWGATDAELARAYPGDGLVSSPTWGATHAISIAAPPEKVWPWVVQLGQGRGGFYSYTRLENLVGSQIRNSNTILPEFQALSVGDGIRLHRDIPPMRVALLKEGRALVLQGDPSGAEETSDLEGSWALLIEPNTNQTTRLISRTRYRHGSGIRSRLIGGPALIEPISYVMERKMLGVIKGLVEASNSQG